MKNNSLCELSLQVLWLYQLEPPHHYLFFIYLLFHEFTWGGEILIITPYSCPFIVTFLYMIFLYFMLFI